MPKKLAKWDFWELHALPAGIVLDTLVQAILGHSGHVFKYSAHSGDALGRMMNELRKIIAFDLSPVGKETFDICDNGPWVIILLPSLTKSVIINKGSLGHTVATALACAEWLRLNGWKIPEKPKTDGSAL